MFPTSPHRTRHAGSPGACSQDRGWLRRGERKERREMHGKGVEEKQRKQEEEKQRGKRKGGK